MLRQIARFSLFGVAILAFAAGSSAYADDDKSHDSAQAGGATESHEHIGQAGGANADPAEVRRDLAIYTFVVFLALLAILWKWAWGPIASSLEAREKHIHNEIAEAERANAEAKRLLA